MGGSAGVIITATDLLSFTEDITQHLHRSPTVWVGFVETLNCLLPALAGNELAVHDIDHQVPGIGDAALFESRRKQLQQQLALVLKRPRRHCREWRAYLF